MVSSPIRYGLIVALLVLSGIAAGERQERITQNHRVVAETEQQSARSRVLSDQCQEITALILAGSRNDAMSRLEQTLHDAGTAEVAEIAGRVLDMTAQLRTAGHGPDARDLEKRLVAVLAGRPQSERVSYRTLQEAFFRGQNEFLLDYGREGNVQDWRSRRLLAEAAADEFIGLDRVGPDAAAKQRATEMARICTNHYEAAVLAAPDQYTRTQIACGWLSMARQIDRDDAVVL